MNDFDYSQHGEQIAILKYFGNFVGRFLDIGAFDGITGSNTRALSDRGWQGVCVEANPRNFFNLLQNHSGNEKIELICAAMMPAMGVTRLWDTHEPQLSRCETKPDTRIKSNYFVACLTPRCLTGPFDFVSFDIEGADLEVLKCMGPILEHTQLICLEDYIPFDFHNEKYYSELMATAASFGFNKLIARTGNGVGNTLLAKA